MNGNKGLTIFFLFSFLLIEQTISIQHLIGCKILDQLWNWSKEERKRNILLQKQATVSFNSIVKCKHLSMSKCYENGDSTPTMILIFQAKETHWGEAKKTYEHKQNSNTDKDVSMLLMWENVVCKLNYARLSLKCLFLNVQLSMHFGIASCLNHLPTAHLAKDYRNAPTALFMDLST